MTAHAEPLIRLFEDSKQRGTCRGCGAAIAFFETLSNKRLPMNAGAVPRKSEIDPDRRRVVAFYAASDSHFASCPNRSEFSTR